MAPPIGIASILCYVLSSCLAFSSHPLALSRRFFTPGAPALIWNANIFIIAPKRPSFFTQAIRVDAILLLQIHYRSTNLRGLYSHLFYFWHLQSTQEIQSRFQSSLFRIMLISLSSLADVETDETRWNKNASELNWSQYQFQFDEQLRLLWVET